MTWQQTKLGDILTLNYGKNLPKSARIHGNIGVYGSNGAVDKHNIPITNGKTIIIGRKGSLGEVHLSANSCFPIDTTFFIDKNSTKQDLDWLFFKLKSLPLTALNNSTSVPGLNRNEAYSLSLRLPPLPEQHKIASILTALNDKIQNNHNTAATLEEMARALYRSWFVDFDPIHARAEGRAPAHMDAAIAALFPDRFGEDGLPEGWSMGALQDIIKFNPKDKIKKGDVAPYYDMKALPTEGMINKHPVFKPFTSGSKFRKYDTLLARITPCLENGKTTLIHNLDEKLTAWGSTEFIVMRPKEHIPAILPYCIARDKDFREKAIATMTGSSGRQRADAQAISDINMAIPDMKIFQLFDYFTKGFLSKISVLSEQSQTLATLRDTLLPRLMSGELRVSAAKEMIKEARS